MEPAVSPAGDAGTTYETTLASTWAAMEPAVSPAGDPQTAVLSRSDKDEPQWSPPFHRRVTRDDQHQPGDIEEPQWSPPFHRRVTPASVMPAATHRHEAAMEPAVSPAGDPC